MEYGAGDVDGDTNATGLNGDGRVRAKSYIACYVQGETVPSYCKAPAYQAS